MLDVSDQDRQWLEAQCRSGKTEVRIRDRCRIILACLEVRQDGEQAPIVEVARNLGVTVDMVRKWRRRFAGAGREGLADAPRSGHPRTIPQETITQVVIDTLTLKPPGGDSHWSTNSMARHARIGNERVWQIWKAYGLAPHRVDSFKFSRDPLFADKVIDIVGLYMDPPEGAVALCVDEKSGTQALERSQTHPMRRGCPEAHAHDYKRHGTTSLFAAYDLLTGTVIPAVKRRHRRWEFLEFLDQIDTTVPQDKEVHLVMDNYGTHKCREVRDWLVARPRFHVHYTPTSSSWINLVERFFSEITTKKIRRTSYESVEALEMDILDWITRWNEDPRVFIWTVPAEDILNRVNSRWIAHYI